MLQPMGSPRVRHDRVTELTEWDLEAEPGGSVVKNLLANAGDARYLDLTPGSEDLLEKEMTTHSSILAWRISWTEEPGGLQSMSQRVRHN